MKDERKELKKKRTAVDYRGKTSNGYLYHINKEGEVAIYCKKGEYFQKSKELRKAVHEILDTSRAAIFYKGNSFDSEPLGSPANVEIVTREEAAKMVMNLKSQ